MLAKKKHPFIAAANIIIFSVLIIFNSVEGVDISIKNAVPVILLPALTAFSMFSTVKSSAVAGFLIGAALDSTASGSYCFNTLLFLVIGAFVCVFANNLFNKNIFAATVLSLLTAVFYFFLLWIFFHSFSNKMENSMLYLLKYALPSAAYTAVFIFPFYWIFKKFDQIKAQ